MKRTFFTLVELLVVVAIIAILAGMLLPALNKARETAKTTTCLSNKKQVMLGIQLYANDAKNMVPVFQNKNSWGMILSNNPLENTGSFTPYISWTVSTCPSASQPSIQEPVIKVACGAAVRECFHPATVESSGIIQPV